MESPTYLHLQQSPFCLRTWSWLLLVGQMISHQYPYRANPLSPYGWEAYQPIRDNQVIGFCGLASILYLVIFLVHIRRLGFLMLFTAVRFNSRTIYCLDSLRLDCHWPQCWYATQYWEEVPAVRALWVLGSAFLSSSQHFRWLARSTADLGIISMPSWCWTGLTP